MTRSLDARVARDARRRDGVEVGRLFVGKQRLYWPFAIPAPLVTLLSTES